METVEVKLFLFHGFSVVESQCRGVDVGLLVWVQRINQPGHGRGSALGTTGRSGLERGGMGDDALGRGGERGLGGEGEREGEMVGVGHYWGLGTWRRSGDGREDGDPLGL